MKIIKILTLLLGLTILYSCRNEGNEIIASGVFEATEIIISSQSSGEIINFPVEEGDLLEPDQVLAVIDSVQLELKKDQLLAGIEIAESRRPDIEIQLAPLIQQISTAQKEKIRIENLLKAGAANEKQYDDINGQLLLLNKQLTSQRNSLEKNNLIIDKEINSQNIQIEQIEDQINKCSVKSPIGGTVIVKYAEAGELVVPGKALIKIADRENMSLRAYVSSSHLTSMQLGQNVTVFSDFGAKDNRTYTGTIKWISDKAEFTPKTVQTRDERSNLVYAVKIAVPNDGYLKIGMYGGIKSENE